MIYKSDDCLISFSYCKEKIIMDPVLLPVANVSMKFHWIKDWIEHIQFNPYCINYYIPDENFHLSIEK